MSTTASVLQSLAAALGSGSVRVVDLTQPLHEKTPVLKLPEPFANTPGLTRHEISRYDDRGPAWAWNWLEIGEHVGTHFDAPIHWITGKGGQDLASVPPERLVGPAVMIDKSAEAAADSIIEQAKLQGGSRVSGHWEKVRAGQAGRRIIEEAQDMRAAAVVLALPQRVSGLSVFGKTLETVLAERPCRVIIESRPQPKPQRKARAHDRVMA